MRVIRPRDFKLIGNLAHGLPYPFASDLWDAPTWPDIYRHGMETKYGARTVQAYIHRAPFELYDLRNDPNEMVNLADDPQFADLLAELKADLKEFQKRTEEPWLLKWDHE